MSNKLSTFQERFGSNLKRLRKNKGYSQLELAIHCELEKTAVFRIENGRTNITLRTVELLAKALDVEPYSLFKFE